MSRSTLRIVILLSTLVTGLVHLVLLSIQLGGPSPIFILNGLGYLVLLALFWFNPSFLGGRRTLLHYAFMAYAAVTILLWVATGTKDLTGYLTKAAEVVLFVALWANLRAEEAEKQAEEGEEQTFEGKAQAEEEQGDLEDQGGGEARI